MKNSKNRIANRALVALLLLTAPAVARAMASGGPFTITKDLTSTPGSGEMAAGIYEMAFSFGEQTTGPALSSSATVLLPGYFGGPGGTGWPFFLISSQVGTTKILQDGVQIGVPLQASITLTFSDQVLPLSVANGIQVNVLMDHFGNALAAGTTVPYTYTLAGQTVTLQPLVAWQGNTFYDVALTPALFSIGGFPMNQVTHVSFVTVLDPQDDNVVLHPLTNSAAGFPVAGGAAEMNLHVPPDAFSGYTVIRFSNDPVGSPLQINPQILSEANAKASAASAYRVPLAYREVVAYDLQGNAIQSLLKPAELSISYSKGQSGPPIVRSQTLSLFALDASHRLWVKMPASRTAADGSSFAASVGQLSVFSVMGSADDNAADAYVFPNPWRPHGPSAGEGAGQSGSEAGGMTFANLPSECKISIYTISGERVRELRHSDTVGPIAEEKWDVLTTHGERVASGVYLWRVESASDGKNGKLIVIQ